MVWTGCDSGVSIAMLGFAYVGIDRTAPAPVHVNESSLDHVHAVGVQAVAD